MSGFDGPSIHDLPRYQTHADYRAYEAEERSSEEEIRRLLLAQRGRWLVVHEDGSCYRMESKGAARRHIALMREYVGDAAHLRRYRRDRVRYVGGGLEVTDARWVPRTRYSIR